MTPWQDHPQRPRNEDELTKVSPRFYYLHEDLTTAIRDQLDFMFRSMN